MGEIEVPRNDWLHPRCVAIRALGDERFNREDVVPMLMQIEKEAELDFSYEATRVLYKLRMEGEIAPR